MPGVLDSVLGFGFVGVFNSRCIYIHIQKYCQGIVIIILREIMPEKVEGILPAHPHALLLKGKGRKKQAKYQSHSLNNLFLDFLGGVTDRSEENVLL